MFRNALCAPILRVLKTTTGTRLSCNRCKRPAGYCYRPCPCRPIPPNPCCPITPHGNHKPYKYVFFFVCLPLIATQIVRAFGGAHCEKEPCRHFEYMRRRTKKYPWGDGEETFFHNEHINNLPSECVDLPQEELVCEDPINMKLCKK